MPCKHVSLASPTGRIRCGLMASLGFAGLRFLVPETFCARCEARDADAPKLAACPQFASLLRRTLAFACILGELPCRTQSAWFDMGAAFARYRAIAGDAAARALLPTMVNEQRKVSVAAGGLPAATLEARFEQIAAANGMSDVLQQLATTTPAAQPGVRNDPNPR